MRAPANAEIVRVTFVVGGLIAVALLALELAEVLLLAFGAVVVATVIWTLTRTIQRYTRLPHSGAFMIAMAIISIVLLGFVVLLGANVVEQADRIVEALPELLDTLGAELGIENLYPRVVEWADALFDGAGIFSSVAGLAGPLAIGIANVVVVAAAGTFMAWSPGLYRDGALKLVPAPVRVSAARALGHAGAALRQWLTAQLLGMAIVGAVTTLGLYAIGMPSALALGFIAGMAEFVPFVGPFASAVPAVLVAVSEGGLMPLWVVILYIAVQQLEGNLITPLIYRRVVHLPPALTLFTILAFGVLFGPLGVVLSAPLAVVLFVLVKQLYVLDTLNVETSLPGGDAVNSAAAATAAAAAPPAADRTQPT